MTERPTISSYFSQEDYEHEKSLFKDSNFSYVGHKLMVPNNNDYHVSLHTHEKYTLFNLDSNYSLLSNVCPHRQAQLLEGSGNKKNVACKLHCWSFSNKGELKGTPFFESKVDQKLELKDTYEWNGLLFKNQEFKCDLKKAGIDHLLNFDDYFYQGTQTDHYDYNWKNFVEIYLENYHVFSMHPGLKNFVTPQDLEWIFSDSYSIQKVGIGKNLEKPTTDIYRQWQDQVLKEHEHKELRYGAIWMFIYPNIMLEWYPNTIVVSTIYPSGPTSCTNHVEFYYPKSLYKENPQYFNAEKKAYLETAIEDNEACMLLHKGRKSLYHNSSEQQGPIEPFLEAGVQKFYEFLHSKLS